MSTITTSSALTHKERRMHAELNRRNFLGLGISSAVLSSLSSTNHAPIAQPAAAANSFPQQDPALVLDIVGAAHSNLARVKELLALQPALAKASYDWGFGDWESPLGAASHVGNRPIAALLLEAGARPSIFSAAMLGQLSVVRAFIDASPGIQRVLGPHSISLLSHARAGGAASQPVVDYLVSTGGTESAPPIIPLTAPERAMFVGTYTFGNDPSETFEIALTNETLSIQRPGFSKRNIRHAGSNEFWPVGGEQVRLKFAVAAGLATSVAVLAPQLLVTAKRT